MKKLTLLVILSFLVSTVILVNIRGTLQNYTRYYHSKEALKENVIYNHLGFLEENDLFRYFLTYTGFETGYGFFAPNVASDFITDFSLYDNQGSLIKRNNLIPLKNKESFIRINTAYGMFLEYNCDDSLNLDYKQCNIFLKGLGLANLKHYSKASEIKIDLYLYHHPTLKQIKTKKLLNPNHVLFTSKTFTNANINWK